MKTVGTYLVELLAAYGVDTVFGIPGVHTVELYRGLPGSGIRHVTPRHEQGAGFMADGYARVTGKPGVCFIITGPGLTNIATAMAQAYGDSMPMLVISSVNAPGRMGSGEGHLHELPDQRQVGRQFTAFSHTVLRAGRTAAGDGARLRGLRLGAAAPGAYRTADRPAHPRRLGPAAGAEAPGAHAPGARTARHRRSCRPVRGGEAAGHHRRRRCGRCRRPAACAGRSARRARGHDGQRPRHAAGRPSARRAVQPGHAPTTALIEAADLVIAAGTEFGPTDFDFYETGGARILGKLIRIDIDPEQAMRGRPADLALISDTKLALEALVPAVSPRAAGDGAERAKTAREGVRAELNPVLRAGAHLMEVVRDTLPDVVIAGDSAQPVYAGCIDFAANKPRSWFCSATGYGTLGYALPAAAGALIGSGRPTVCLAGDGGIQFTLPELGAAREAELPLIVLLWNNNGYGEIKAYMEARGIEPIGVDIYTPDFLTIARGFGCEAEKLEDPRDLPAKLKAAAQRNRPTLIEIDEASYVEFVTAQG